MIACDNMDKCRHKIANGWFHRECLNLTKVEFNTLSNNMKSKWYCDECKNTFLPKLEHQSDTKQNISIHQLNFLLLVTDVSGYKLLSCRGHYILLLLFLNATFQSLTTQLLSIIGSAININTKQYHYYITATITHRVQSLLLYQSKWRRL